MISVYAIPFAVGDTVGGEVVAEIGKPLQGSGGRTVFVPARYRSGRYAIVNCSGHSGTVLTYRNDEAARLTAHSSAMPVIRHGPASDVLHVSVGEDGRLVWIKVFYNFKAHRSEEVHR